MRQNLSGKGVNLYIVLLFFKKHDYFFHAIIMTPNLPTLNDTYIHT